MRKYRLVAKKGEGTFSEVLKAQNVKDSKFHAIKCMKNHFESIDQVNNLREIQALRRLSPHQHIVKLEEVLYDQPSGRLALVFELMDANLYEMIRGRRHYLKPDLVQSLMYQLVKSLDHMHNKGIFHRDIKPENILVEDNSKLKLADFGSCRGIYSKQPYTEYISTRWYRAPECLLTDGYYGPEMDMWGVGCVFFEITSLYPLFPGSNELDQIHRIHKILGTPPPEVLEIFKRKGAAHIDFNFPKEDGTSIAKLIPHASPAAIDLMHKMLAYDPSKRMNAREALRHEYFREIRELEEATLRAQQQQQQQHVLQPQQQPSIGLPMTYKQRKGNDNDDKVPLPSIQNGSHGTQAPSDTKDYGSYDASEDELPPINNAAGGRGLGSITKSKANKYSYGSKNGNNNKVSEGSQGGGSLYSGASSKPSKSVLSTGGSTNRSTYQDPKSRKIVANVTLKKGIPSARTKKIVGSSAAYADVSASWLQNAQYNLRVKSQEEAVQRDQAKDEHVRDPCGPRDVVVEHGDDDEDQRHHGGRAAAPRARVRDAVRLRAGRHAERGLHFVLRPGALVLHGLVVRVHDGLRLALHGARAELQSALRHPHDDLGCHGAQRLDPRCRRRSRGPQHPRLGPTYYDAGVLVLHWKRPDRYPSRVPVPRWHSELGAVAAVHDQCPEHLHPLVVPVQHEPVRWTVHVLRLRRVRHADNHREGQHGRQGRAGPHAWPLHGPDVHLRSHPHRAAPEQEGRQLATQQPSRLRHPSGRVS